MEEKVFNNFGGFPRFLHLNEYLCGHFVLMPVILAHKQIIFMKTYCRQILRFDDRLLIPKLIGQSTVVV